MFPDALAGRRIDRAQRAELLKTVDQLTAAARNTNAEFDAVRGLLRFPDRACLVSRYEEQLPLGIECGRLKIGAAVIVGKALVQSADVIKNDRTSTGIDFSGPVRTVDERLCNEQLSCLSVERVEERIPVCDH